MMVSLFPVPKRKNLDQQESLENVNPYLTDLISMCIVKSKIKISLGAVLRSC